MRHVHRMFITFIHRTQESRNTKNTYDFLVQVRNFLLPLSLKVLQHKERDTHSFYSCFSIPPTNTWATRHKATGLASARKRKPTVFSRSRTQLNSLFQNPPNPPRASCAWRHSLSLAPFLSGLLWHIWVTRPLHAHTHLSNPRTEPKGSQSDKPKEIKRNPSAIILLF